MDRPARSISVLTLRASTPLRRCTPIGRGSANSTNESRSVYAPAGAPSRSRYTSIAGRSSRVCTRPLAALVTIIGSPILWYPWRTDTAIGASEAMVAATTASVSTLPSAIRYVPVIRQPSAAAPPNRGTPAPSAA